MIGEINSQKNTPESMRNTAASKTQPSAQASKGTAGTAASKSTPSPVLRGFAGSSAASLAAAAGLPPGKLSSSIVSFARFFSLSLKPQMLADIRREALTPPAPSSVNGREMLSLAAAAAKSKGVELQPKGLESYAKAADPESRWQEPQPNQHGENSPVDGDRQRRRRGREQNEQAEKEPQKTGSITASLIKKMAFEYAEKDPVLNILNKLPGKNGQRWVVFPFDFFEDGREFKVSMRILLDDEKSSNRAVCLALDISISGMDNGEPQNRWLLVMEGANEKPARLIVYLQGELPQEVHSQFKLELSQVLGISLERVSIKNSAESFPHESSCTEHFPSVDEEV